MVYWLLVKPTLSLLDSLLDPRALALVGLLVALQLMGVDLIGAMITPLIDGLTSWLRAQALDSLVVW